MSSESQTSDASVDPELAAKIEEYSRLFDQACQERHDMGEQKYGAMTFLKVNTLQEAAYELIDLSNYARYGFIKLMLLDEAIQDIGSKVSTPEDGSFVPVGNEWKKD